MLRVVAVIFGIAFAYGCAVQVQVVEIPVTKQDYDELKPYTEPGGSSVIGQGFLRQQGGGVVTCAGNRVIMMPATSFYQVWVMIFRRGKTPQIQDPVNPVWRSAIKVSQCDAQGNFSFAKLPKGAWFVATFVQWIVAGVEQGGTLLREVTLLENQTTQALLTDKDFISRQEIQIR
jgi:hypothetical protein